MAPLPFQMAQQPPTFRCLGESRDPLVRSTKGWTVDPGFRRDAELEAERLRRGGEPAGGVAVDERRQCLADSRVVCIEPGDLLVLEQLARDEAAVDRRQGQRLEAQH